MKKALLYEKLKNNKVRCQACSHNCLILPGKTGICTVRKNKGGELYSLTYKKLIARHVDPIEKKPLFHFMPGFLAYSIATIGCNFHCLFCQNADIAQGAKEGFSQLEFPGEDISAKEIVRTAKKENCQIIACTYTEPTIYIEYALEVMKEAKKNGLKNVWVSNGYMTQKALDLIAPYLDAVNIDLKSFSDNFYKRICGARLQPVLDTLKRVKEKNIWLEVTTLLIPGQNDSETEISQIAGFIKNELGPETPWHISRFYPTYKLIEVEPTSEERIRKAYNIGKLTGLKYVYGGNILDEDMENTYCPKCNEVVIKRNGYLTNIKYTDKGQCEKCKEKIDLVLK